VGIDFNDNGLPAATRNLRINLSAITSPTLFSQFTEPPWMNIPTVIARRGNVGNHLHSNSHDPPKILR
jgi:hypothetical protein